MNFWQFIVGIISDAVWPATILIIVLVIVLVFRKTISSLLQRLRRIHLGSIVVELNGVRPLQKIHENEDLLAPTEGLVNFAKYLDLVEAFTFTCGLLAGELRDQPKLKELQQLAEDSFNSGVKKIEKERPEIDSLAIFRSIEKALKSPRRVKWTYRPLHEIIEEKRARNDP